MFHTPRANIRCNILYVKGTPSQIVVNPNMLDTLQQKLIYKYSSYSEGQTSGKVRNTRANQGRGEGLTFLYIV
jgi:hypothetical protein